MKNTTKEKVRKWAVIIIILFMALMLVLAYMPMLFVPDEDVSQGGQATSTRESLPY